jgi:hypothetical protein
MADLAPIAPKLSKLIPMLSSDRDGEVVAAVRAIGRTIQGAGLDFFALSDALSEPKVLLSPASPPPRREPEPEPKTLRDIAAWCRSHDAGRLNDKERRFVNEMVAHLTIGRRISDKQENWLRAIFYRIYGIAGEYVP